MKDKDIWWIIGIIIVGLIFYQYSGLFSVTPGCSSSKCNPIYYSFNGGCYMTCGITINGINYDTCDTKSLYNLYQKYMDGVKVYKDSKCTFSLENYVCTPNWKCNGFTSCSKSKNGAQTRNCWDSNNCGNDEGKPETTRYCQVKCIPNCTNKCGGALDGCGGTCNALCKYNRPKVDLVPSGCLTKWHAGSWGKCIKGVQTRTMVDLSKCGNNADRPPTARICSNTFSIYDLFSILPNPFIKYPNNKDNLFIVYGLAQKQRPLIGGLQLIYFPNDEIIKPTWWQEYITGYKYSYYFCSLGAVTKISGINYFLTAGHCINNSKNFYQGGEYAGSIMSVDHTVDVALVSANPEISNTDAIGNKISNTGSFKKGTQVYKIGARTGLTFGTITMDNIGFINFPYDNNTLLKAPNGDFLIQFSIKGNNGQFCDHGDSGSAIITVSEPHKLLGILTSMTDDQLCYATSMGSIQSQVGAYLSS